MSIGSGLIAGFTLGYLVGETTTYLTHLRACDIRIGNYCVDDHGKAIQINAIDTVGQAQVDYGAEDIPYSKTHPTNSKSGY